MKKLITIALSVLVITQAANASDVVFGERNPVAAVKTALMNGKLDTNQTCFADYLDYHRKLTKYAIWTPVALLPVAVIGSIAGFGVGGVLAVTGVIATNGLAAAATAGGYGFSAGLYGSLGVEGFALVRRIKNKFLVKVIANSYDGKGRSLDKFTRKFLRKNKSFRGTVTSEDLAKLIVTADKSRALCNGEVNTQSRGNEYRRKLARKNHIFKYLQQAL